MKPELAEKIRSNLITQALIVVLCVTFSNNRRSQTSDMMELENLYVSHRLMTATAGEVRNNDLDDDSAQAAAGMAGDLDKYGAKNPEADELDAMALFLSQAKPAYAPPVHRVSLPSGGWLRFHADFASFKELAPPPSTATVPLYELTVVVTADSDLHQQGELRFTFTNAEQSVDPVTRSKVWEPMPLRAVVKGEAEPMAEGDIEGRILLKARSWTSATGAVDNLYSASRYSYENEEISVPVANIQVSASMALAAIALVATALCAWMSYQCRQSQASSDAIAEPHQGVLILKPKEGTVAPGVWHGLLAHAEIWFVQPPYWIGILSPVICTLLLSICHADIDYSWLGWVLLPFAVGYVWLLARAIVGVAWTKR